MHILIRSEKRPQGLLFVQPFFHEVRQNGPEGDVIGQRLDHTDHFSETAAYCDHLAAYDGEPDFVPRELLAAKALFDLDWMVEPDEGYHTVLRAYRIELGGEQLWWVETRPQKDERRAIDTRKMPAEHLTMLEADR
jgi:maltooligosyltrehalose synthase